MHVPCPLIESLSVHLLFVLMSWLTCMVSVGFHVHLTLSEPGAKPDSHFGREGVLITWESVHFNLWGQSVTVLKCNQLTHSESHLLPNSMSPRFSSQLHRSKPIPYGQTHGPQSIPVTINLPNMWDLGDVLISSAVVSLIWVSHGIYWLPTDLRKMVPFPRGGWEIYICS